MFKDLCLIFITAICIINFSMFLTSGVMLFHPLPKNNLMKITGFYYSSEYGKRLGIWLIKEEF